MLTSYQLKNLLVFDLETAPAYQSFEQMQQSDPELAKHWEDRCDFYWRKYSGYEEKSVAELFDERASLEPEFLKIVAASFATISQAEAVDDFYYQLINVYSEVESNLVDHCTKVINYADDKFSKPMLFGHNISDFDIPVLGRRIIISNSVANLPDMLKLANKKPWEVQMMELNSIWAFASFKNKFTPLDLICHSLGVESPKQETQAKQVSEIYYNDNDLYRIATYCGKDVKSTLKCAAKLAGVEITDELSQETFIQK
jgi:hypothetical protein